MVTAEQRAWTERVLSMRLPDPAQSLAHRVKEAQALAVAHGVLAEVTPSLRPALLAVKAAEPKAAELVGDLEDELARLMREKRLADAVQAIAQAALSDGTGPVAAAKLRLRVKAAREAMEGAVDTLREAWYALLETDDYAGDPRCASPEVFAAIANIKTRLPLFDTAEKGINAAIDQIDKLKDTAERGRAAAAAVADIAAYRQQIDANPLLAEMESTEAGSFALRAPICEALDDLADALTNWAGGDRL